MTMEKEEQERKELQKMIMGEDNREELKKAPKKDEDESGQYGYGTSGASSKQLINFSSFSV